MKNLQTIATHERFVEGVVIVHLEEFVKVDMDLFGSAIVLPWALATIIILPFFASFMYHACM
jgi:hypothetical protein